MLAVVVVRPRQERLVAQRREAMAVTARRRPSPAFPFDMALAVVVVRPRLVFLVPLGWVVLRA